MEPSHHTNGLMLRRRWLIAAILAATTVAAATRLPFAIGETKQSDSKAAKKTALKPGEIDLEKSRVYVRVGKKGLGHEHGVEGKIKSGSIDVQAEKNSGVIEFDMASFTADTDAARKAVELKGTISETTRDKVTETMRGESVLDVEQFPTATFKIKSRAGMEAGSEGPRYTLKGDFTLHGETRPLEFIVERTDEAGRIRLRGNFTILQSDFGITPYKAALGTVGVADELKIWGDVWIAREEATKK